MILFHFALFKNYFEWNITKLWIKEFIALIDYINRIIRKKYYSG